MTKDDKKKLPYELSESLATEELAINPPGYKKQKKFSKIMEKALDAVAQLGKKTMH
jgi:hypothetical protein